MRVLILVLAFLIPVPGLDAGAQAGPYVSAGVGSGPALGGDFDGVLSTDGHGAGRVGIGHRLGPASLEAAIAGFGITATAPTGQSANGTALSGQISAKLGMPLVLGVGVFGRAGLERTWMGPTPTAKDRLIGDGKLLGAGLEYNLDLVLASAGVWLEVDRDWITVSSHEMTFSGTADSVMAGLRFGI
jgi:hypothetical protein